MQNSGGHNEIVKKTIKSKDVKNIFSDRMIPIKTDGC